LYLSPHGAAGSGISRAISPNSGDAARSFYAPVDQVLTFAFIAYSLVRFAVGVSPG
jgi:hypothetical protein